MNHPHSTRREVEARYRSMQSGALVAGAALLLTALVSNSIYPSSVWFLATSAVGGAFIFISWHRHATKPEDSGAFFPVLGVAISVAGLLVEIDRPIVINLVCGYSVFGAVMFGLIEIARRRQLPRQ